MLNNSYLISLLTITLSSPGAVAFHIGAWPIRWYGIFIALGFVFAYLLAEKLVQRNNLNLNHFNDLIFLVLIFSIVFARLYFVILSWDYFKNHLDEIPKIWYGGQSIHGGIIGAVLATLLYSRVKKTSFYNYMDIIAVVTPLGQAIGRWGNFFNNEAFGKPLEEGQQFPCNFLQLYIPTEYRPESYINNQYFHPMFLYESFLNFLLFLFLYKKYLVWSKNPGKLFWIYLFCYSIIRFFLEFFRIDSLYLFDHFASAHVVSIIIILISLIALIKKWKN